MKQVLQSLKTGETMVTDVPMPALDKKSVLIRTSNTLISSGTERTAVDFGRAGWLAKARQQPDKVRQTLRKVKTDGLLSTVEAVRSKLDQPLALGYCNVGTVVEAGAAAGSLSPGMRVVSNGSHAEYVCVSKNLCARVPDNVADKHAAFTVLGAIGLQGIRLAQPTIGECFVVTGLGLIGQLTVQILRSHGCRVLGIDFDSSRLAMAESFGAQVVNLGDGEDPIAAAADFSRGRGVDAVIITASSSSNEPVSQAATMCRKRGRIVLVGVTGLQLSRADFYEKELSFQVSCSYGPGRYDKDYEVRGNDYPVGFVRWTEQRNFEAVLDLLAAGQLDVEPLISHRYTIDEAVAAYDTLVSDKRALGILLEYASESESMPERTVRLREPDTSVSAGEPIIGVIGAGNYSGRMLMPVIRDAGAGIKTLVNQGGAGGVHYAKKFAIETLSSDPSTVFDDPEVNLVFVATRHDSHAEYVLAAIDAGKHVFVEKPLCLTLDELAAIESAIENKQVVLMVGFNRRFSPLTVKARELISTSRSPKAFVMTVNAGAIPADHWTRDPQIGGGRILGEACHFIDLLRHLAGSAVTDYSAVSVDAYADDDLAAESAIINLKFADGSIGSIQYLTSGNSRYPKERLEVYVEGKILRLDNFRQLRGWGWSGFSSQKLRRQDKGQRSCIVALMTAIRNGQPSPVDFQEIIEVSRISIELGALTR